MVSFFFALVLVDFLIVFVAFEGDWAAFCLAPLFLRPRTFDTACIRRMRSSSALMGSGVGAESFGV